MSRPVRPRAEAAAAEALSVHLRKQIPRLERRAERIAGLVELAGGSAVDAYLIATHADVPAHAQARALGVSKTMISTWRGALYRAGRIRLEDRARGAPCAPAEVAAIARLYRDGYSIYRIAEMRTASRKRVLSALRRAGVGQHDRPALLTINALADLLGVNHQTVRGLLRRGWLIDARVGVAKSGGLYGWTRADVYDLLRQRPAWLAVAPGGIRDSDLAAFLRREQAQAGGRWYTRDDIAALIGVTGSTVSGWATAGLLDGLPAAAWGSLDCVWLTHAQAIALEAAAAPVRAMAGQGANAVRRALAPVWPAIRAALGPARAVAAD